MAIIVSDLLVEIKHIPCKNQANQPKKIRAVLTLKKDVRVLCPHCGTELVKCGYTQYKKHIEDLNDDSNTVIAHLQLLTCPNKDTCRDFAEKKNTKDDPNLDNKTSKRKATHILLPDYACPSMRLRTDEAQDIYDARLEISRLKRRYKHKKLSQKRLNEYISQSPVLKAIKKKYCNFLYFISKALGYTGQVVESFLKLLLPLAQTIAQSYCSGYQEASPLKRGLKHNPIGKSIFRNFAVYSCSYFVTCLSKRIKRNWSYTSLSICNIQDG